MHPDTEHIVALHKSDLACEALRKTIRSLKDSLKSATQKVGEAEALAAKERSLLADLQAREESATKRYERYLDKAEATRQLMETGQVSNYEAAQAQLDQCLEIADTEETSLLELMEEIEASTEAIASRERQVSLRVDQKTAREDALTNELPSLTKSLAEADALRSARAGELREDHLSLYEQIRKKLRHAVAEIHEDACNSCGMVISSMPLAEHRRGSAVHRCRNCGRFLGESI